ncbi:Centrin-1 [Coemansia interrupta]|uniref:Centrin-1 n=1 Tax=Coemansia interrupta TaxID=1126814 RepID=A0A9W8HNM7_9FUNG|nr:Centrin-1 [Coemansia interrupta]
MVEGRYGRGRTNNTADDASPPAARTRAASKPTRPKPTSLLRTLNQHEQLAEQETYATTANTYSMAQDLREDVEEIFGAMDPKGRGFLKLSSLSRILENLKLIQPGESVPEEWYDDVDPRRTGKITLEALLEFVSAQDGDAEAEQQLASAFRLFKPDAEDVHSSRITFEDLQRVSLHLGEHIPDSELHDMISFIDSHSSGGVDFDDFKHMMKRTGLF